MLSRPGRLLGLLLLLLLDFVKVSRWCNLCFCCRIMRDIVVELWDGEQKIASKQYKHPLTAAELKTALAQENKDWTGTLQKAGSSTVLNGGRRLVGGASHHFRLQTSSKNKHSPEGLLFTPAVKADLPPMFGGDVYGFCVRVP